jgi:hypothetical protein
VNGVPGDTSRHLVGVTNPVPPENLSCGGTSPTTATCVWINKEWTDTEIWRRSFIKWTLVGYLTQGGDQFNDTGLSTGVTYSYRARHIKFPGYYPTGWSNTDAATPGSVPEPYRPIR